MTNASPQSPTGLSKASAPGADRRVLAPDPDQYTSQYPLRVLHTESSTGWGGQELRVLTEASGMLGRGHQVTLVTPAAGKIFTAARERAIPAMPLPIERKSVLALAAMRRWLAHHAREFDVINTHSSTDAWLVAVASLFAPGLPPVVRTRHVSTPVRNNSATRWLYTRATAHIVTTGEALRRQLALDSAVPLEHTTSVRTGIDLSLFRPLPRAACRAALGIDERPALGILATLRDWKGHDYLLHAWTRLRDQFPNWQLLVIGDGPQAARLQLRVVSEGLAQSVRFVGNQDNVVAWLSSLDLFVLPSYGEEGVPQAIMQAMACGLAVVSTPVGAINEAVKHNCTGLIVEPRNATALAEALARLMSNGSLRQHLGEAGRRYAQENFGIDAMLDKMEAVFRRVIESRARS